MAILGLEVSKVAGKPKPVIVEVKDFGVYLAARMGALGLSTAVLAEQLDVTPAAIYAMLAGDLVPGDLVVKKLGLRPAFIMNVPATRDPEPPAKPTKGKKS